MADCSIIGSEAKDELIKANDEHFKSASYVRKSKNHETCDDNALLVVNERFALIGVFDGLSAEPFAQQASEKALRAAKFFITQTFDESCDERIVERAIEEANYAIDRGATTASIALVLPNGEFFFANVGDSHIYKRNTYGKFQRLTKDDRQANGSGFVEYANSRRVVAHTLGGLIGIINIGKGKLEKGEYLFAMSDGILDNLVVEMEGGTILDASGANDLEIVIGNNSEPKEIAEELSKEIKDRMHDSEKNDNGKILIPKEDDASIVILKF